MSVVRELLQKQTTINFINLAALIVMKSIAISGYLDLNANLNIIFTYLFLSITYSETANYSIGFEWLGIGSL